MKLKLLTLTFALSLTPTARAALPPGPGNSPPPNTKVSSRYLAVSGRLPGQPDGVVGLHFQLSSNAGAPMFAQNPPPPLYVEDQNVTVHGEQFVVSLGAGTPSGIPPSLLEEKTSLGVSWALTVSPDVPLGSAPIAATAFAMTLAPGASTSSNSAAPTLDLSNAVGPGLVVSNQGNYAAAGQFAVEDGTSKEPAIRATSSAPSGRGIVGISTATSGASYGVEARSYSLAGAAALFLNDGGDLLQGRNAVDGSTVFRVDNQGRIFANGVQVGLPGKQGPQGERGFSGQNGPAGSTGPAGRSTFCIAATGASCLGRCTGGALLVGATQSPCTITSSSNPCSYAGSDGVCCACSP